MAPDRQRPWSESGLIITTDHAERAGAQGGRALLEGHRAGGAVPVAGLTVAVKVTAWPKTEGLGGEAASAVVVTVAAWLTAWLSAVEVLAVKLLSPP